MDAALKLLVTNRADDRCEYCRLPRASAPSLGFHIEHVLPRQHGGTDDAANLALACSRCNLHKGTNLTGIDPLTRKVVLLFNPRRQRWSRHFEWQGLRVIGKTPVGRATVAVLGMNHLDRIGIRDRLRNEGLFPFAER
jgi:hypothetical protein